MNGSVGMDLAEISRIRKAMENPRFLLEFFTKNERAYITARHTPEQSAAGAWAAKEAFSKGKCCTIHWGSRFYGCMDGQHSSFQTMCFH